jgi:hypothetical protein
MTFAFSEGPPIPPEWTEVVKRAGRTLDVDEILQALLS